MRTEPELLWVKVTDSEGCQGSDTMMLEVCDVYQLFSGIPNTITPGMKDGKNDRWIIPNIDLFRMPCWRFMTGGAGSYSERMMCSIIHGMVNPCRVWKCLWMPIIMSGYQSSTYQTLTVMSMSSGNEVNRIEE